VRDFDCSTDSVKSYILYFSTALAATSMPPRFWVLQLLTHLPPHLSKIVHRVEGPPADATVEDYEDH